MEHLLSSLLIGNQWTQGDKIGVQNTPRVWIFWTKSFYNLKKSQSNQDEGSNFILSSLEVGY